MGDWVGISDIVGALPGWALEARTGGTAAYEHNAATFLKEHAEQNSVDLLGATKEAVAKVVNIVGFVRKHCHKDRSVLNN